MGWQPLFEGAEATGSEWTAEDPEAGIDMVLVPRVLSES